MINLGKIKSALNGTRLEGLASGLISQSIQVLQDRVHGDRQGWLNAINLLPNIPVSDISLDQDNVSVLTDTTLSSAQEHELRQSLMCLHPWRKGPFNLFGVEVDSEWQSNLKWARIADSLSPLKDRLVLDVGCGNGYYLWRMLDEGAKLAMGIDPTQLFLAQFKAVQHYIDADSIFILPLKSEQLFCQNELEQIDGFDTVFSMGIYYHRRNPVEHLIELHQLLRPGGELVLETLVIEGDNSEEFLVPKDRYAQMRNVWCIPTVNYLVQQLVEANFNQVRLIDLTPTTTNEQRKTDWMTFDSLANFLDQKNSNLTIEGYPAPLRACLIARRN